MELNTSTLDQLACYIEINTARLSSLQWICQSMLGRIIYVGIANCYKKMANLGLFLWPEFSENRSFVYLPMLKICLLHVYNHWKIHLYYSNKRIHIFSYHLNEQDDICFFLVNKSTINSLNHLASSPPDLHLMLVSLVTYFQSLPTV